MKTFTLWYAEDCPNCKVLKALLREIMKDHDLDLKYRFIEEDPIGALMNQIIAAPSLTEVFDNGNQRKITIAYDRDKLIKNLGLRTV